MNGRPLGTRKKFQLLVLLTLLLWATQTLLHQWGYGAEIAPAPAAPAAPAAAAPNAPASVDDPAVRIEAPPEADRATGRTTERSAEPPADGVEKFVPGLTRQAAGGTLELRDEANVYGGEARLKQLCRWSDADAPVFFPVADLVLVRLDAKTQFKPVSLEEIKATLRDAGVNLGVVRFAGATRCTVRRTDAKVSEESMTLEQWVAARRGEKPAEAPAPAAKRAPERPAAVQPVQPAAFSPTSVTTVTEPPAVRLLRSLLVNDIAVRLSLPAEQLEVSFNPKDDNLLNLSEPQFRFNLDARRVRNLGEVEWEVTVVANNSSRKTPVLATARAWQSQVVVNKPLSYRQLIRDTDVTERRTLVDRVGDEPLLAKSQVVGQLAARDLKPGTVLTARMVDAVPLAKPGQLISVTTRRGNIRIQTVARALEGGTFGQAIRVKNDATNEFYDVVLTGPQEGVVGAAAQPSPSSPTADAKLAAARD